MTTNALPLFTGCATALVTPFLPNGQLDENALRHLIKIQVNAQIDALVLLGTTGEPCTLSMQERQRIIEIGLEVVNHAIPIIVGTGSNDTRQAIEYARQAKALGVQGQLCVTPYYNKTTQTGLIHHFAAILDACDLPMILYNVPSRTGMGIKTSTIEKIIQNFNIAGIKEASGDIALTAELLSKTSLPIYCGNDDLILPLMAMGASGVISVLSNVLPNETHALAHACLSGHIRQAQILQQSLLPLIKALFSQVSPIPTKAALSMLGLIHDKLRLPLTPLEEPYRCQLQDILKKHLSDI